MLPVDNHLALAFRNISSGQVVQIHSLTQHHSYPVVNARRVTTQYGPTVLLTFRTDTNINIQIYLPRRYADVVDDDINDINTGKNYNLIYIGKTGSAYVLHMEL